MQIILHDVEGDSIVECPQCHWKGKSSELKKGEYMELSDITEVFCPFCEKYLGFIQHEAGRHNDPN